MSGAAESLVLVEGFDDRDFWKGLLLHLGCKEARTAPPTDHRRSPGFTYLASSGALVHVIPFKALPGISKGAELLIVRVSGQEAACAGRERVLGGAHGRGGMARFAAARRGASTR